MNEKIIISAKSSSFQIPLKEIFAYRDLLYFLTWRDIKVRYKQTLLGFSWAIAQPILQMAVFTVLLGKFAGIPSENVPYPIFVYAGLLPWTFFANSLTSCSNSAINNAGLIRNIYFPRLIIPLSSIGPMLIDFGLAFLVLLALMVIYGFAIHIQFLMIIPLTLLLILTSLGVGTLVAALAVSYRDFRYIMPFAVHIWFFLTPVIYPPTILGKDFMFWLKLNPMTGIIGGFRDAILQRPFDWNLIGLASLIALLLFLAGNLYFASVQSKFADIV